MNCIIACVSGVYEEQKEEVVLIHLVPWKSPLKNALYLAPKSPKLCEMEIKPSLLASFTHRAWRQETQIFWIQNMASRVDVAQLTSTQQHLNLLAIKHE